MKSMSGMMCTRGWDDVVARTAAISDSGTQVSTTKTRPPRIMTRGIAE